MRNGDFISKGSMNQHGYLEELNPVNTPVYVVNGNETFNERQAIKSNIYIPSNAKLTVKNVLKLLGNTTISIDNGGELIIDGLRFFYYLCRVSIISIIFAIKCHYEQKILHYYFIFLISAFVYNCSE